MTGSRYEAYRAKASRRHGYVYLLRCRRTGFYKIGWTLKSPAERLNGIRAEFRNGFDWRLVGAVACYNPPRVEEALHDWLDHARITDKREWFALTGSEAEALTALFASEDGIERAHDNGYLEGFQDGIEAGRHLQELDRLDEREWKGFTWDEQYQRETEVA